MLRILVVSSNLNIIESIRQSLSEYKNIQIETSEFGMKAIEIINKEMFDLVIIDEVLDDMTGIKLAEKVVSKNPLVNSAVISGLSPDEFHEATEGLGILMQLPISPAKADIDNLMMHLKKIQNISLNIKDSSA